MSEVNAIETSNVKAPKDLIHTLLDSFLDRHPNHAHKRTPSHTVSTPNSEHHVVDIANDEFSCNVEKFLISLATCYQLYGCPPHIIEANIPRVAKGLGVSVNFLVLPTHALLSITHGEARSRSVFFKTANGFDMYKLQLTDELVRRVASYATETAPKLVPMQSLSTVGVQASRKSSRGEYKPIEASDINLALGEDTGSTVKLKGKILNLAAFGPGFFSSPSAPPSAEERRPSVIGVKNTYAKVFSRIAVEDAIKHLDDIKKETSLYSHPLQWILNGLASAACCGLFFKGVWIDIGLSFFLGVMVAVLGELNQYPFFTRLYECISAFLVSFIIRLFNYYVSPVCYLAVTLSSVIWLLQGISITLAIVDILSKNLVSGTVRLFYGIVISGIIGFALDLGTTIYTTIRGIDKVTAMGETTCSPTGVSVWFYLPFFLISTVSFNMLINSHYKQLIPMTITAAVGYISSYFLYTPLGMSGSSVVAAFLSGVVSNIYSRWSGNPSIIGVLSSLMLLVPGSVAVKGFLNFLSSSDNSGLGLAVDVLLIATALSIGIFMSSVVAFHHGLNPARTTRNLCGCKGTHEDNLHQNNTIHNVPSMSELTF